jgi:hypothetical protein
VVADIGERLSSPWPVRLGRLAVAEPREFVPGRRDGEMCSDLCRKRHRDRRTRAWLREYWLRKPAAYSLGLRYSDSPTASRASA